MEVSLNGIKGHRSFRSRASTLSKLGFGGRICMTPAGSLEGKSGGARGYRVKNNRPFEAFSSDRFNFFFVSKFERCCQNRGSSKKPLCLQLVKTSWLAALLINMTDRGWILSFFLPLCFLRYTLSRVGCLNQRCSKPLGLLSVVSNVRRGSGSSADTLIDNCSIDLWSPLIYPPASWIFLLSNQSPIILPFHRRARRQPRWLKTSEKLRGIQLSRFSSRICVYAFDALSPFPKLTYQLRLYRDGEEDEGKPKVRYVR